MADGLNIGRLVRSTVNMSPLAVPRRGFGTLLITGDSNVINGSERLRSYADLESVAEDFGTSAPEYLSASLYFGQSPKPSQLMIGRWLRTVTSGFVSGGVLTPSEQALSSWATISNGSFKVTIDSIEKTVTGLDFSAVTNLNGVAAEINTVLTGALASWDGSKFTITSGSTGSTSTVTPAITAGSGTDISAKLKMTAEFASTPVPGYNVETPIQCITELVNRSGEWYGLTFAAATMPTDDELVEVAALIQGASTSRIFGVTETDSRALSSSWTTDLASRLKTLQYQRSFVVFSANKYAASAVFGRAFSVNFNANRSTITLMYKQMPGVSAELLTETQAQTLKAKRCNVFVKYMNDTAIYQYGVMSGQAYFDEIHGLDWFTDSIQNALYNLLYQSKTKIPQTDAGQNQLVNTASNVCAEAINNGLIAPGTWNADGFGQLERGQFLTEGFYIYTPPIALQDQATREERIAPPIQIALKMAGAIHEIDAIINVNR